jgi:YD repeat-containing protein
VVGARRRSGAVLYYSYDALNRLTFEDRPGVEPDLSSTYDFLGRVRSTEQIGVAGSWLGFTYDELGRMTEEFGPRGKVVSAYDGAGRRTKLTHPDGFFVDYDYDATGATTAIRHWGAPLEGGGHGVLARYEYDDKGRRTRASSGEYGTRTEYLYDWPGNLMVLHHHLTSPFTMGGSIERLQL